MAYFVTLAAVLTVAVDALTVYHANASLNKGEPAPPALKALTTFPKYYNSAAGRGIWKWNNALDAYQRHFGGLAGRPLAVAEVGVQSGGSMLMWRGVLGEQIKMYGLDINPKCEQFTGPNVDITIGDQADPNMWAGFFAANTAGLDILVDDGGHEAHQMLTTLKMTFPHIHPGGYALIEDITGAWYLDSFFKPAAAFISDNSHLGLVDSVHIYPLVVVVRKGGFAPNSVLASEGVLTFSANRIVVDNIAAMWTYISEAPPGTHIELRNAAWGSFLVEATLADFFTQFIGLHESKFSDTPKGCSVTAKAVCTNSISPINHLQSRVLGVHIYKDHVIVEVPLLPPTISATRKGTEWITYSL